MCNFWATVFHHVPLISANSLTVIFCSTKKYTLPPRKVVWQGFIAHHSIIWSIDLHFHISGVAAQSAVLPSLNPLFAPQKMARRWRREWWEEENGRWWQWWWGIGGQVTSQPVVSRYLLFYLACATTSSLLGEHPAAAIALSAAAAHGHWPIIHCLH